MSTDLSGPLAGHRIIDFTRLIAGPCAGDLLAAMGADVIKVEDVTGDPMRNARSRRVARGLTAPSFAAYNVHKRSVALDLKDPAGHAAALRLCDGADAVLSSFRPGVLERLGLGADVLRARNPRLVVARLSAFGESGPDRDRGGVDIVMQAESGLMAVTGEADGPPVKTGVPIIDAASGYVLALGVVSALLGRERGGHLREVTVSMLDVAVHLQAQPLAEYLDSRQEPERVGNQAPYAAPADVFPAADGALVLSAHLPQHWTRLCELLDRREWIDDPRFHDVGARVANREALSAALAEVLRTRPVGYWLDLFAAAGLTAGRIRTYREVVGDGTSAFVVDARDVDSSPIQVVRPPLRFPGWADDLLPRQIPRTGEHTGEVLGHTTKEAVA
ncbi:Crotonobetainyl-CoA:carnitine CoA-transferase CaiB [Micromonospora pallida]|uniref:Crotonobetainyl-CoA:carnitine CoA-transferase CaiB n=1 Tax=Micromonospora pallida TaxID=145854 RepID=A0A1C6S079_9ACTN|nr:CoA transferase [Micromonospora pallida]SCL22861.1 Crotonobetainyl-CoA:carnitine CoA-transferase CaiB [Micromonospora pallida]